MERTLVCNGNQTIKLVFVASPLSMQYEGERAKTGWLRIRIMFPSGATCLPTDCCFRLGSAPLQTQGPFHTHFKVLVILLIEDPTVTVKCRTAIKALFLYFNLCLSVMLNGLSCALTSI
jgi:hypothetical protein